MSEFAVLLPALVMTEQLGLDRAQVTTFKKWTYALSMNELQDLMHQLITRAIETTATAIAQGMRLLLTHPDQMELLRSDPDRHMKWIHRGDTAASRPARMPISRTVV
jgi:cytochrome P450